MRKLFAFAVLSMALTLTSCKKNYTKLVPQKVEELKSQGKLILSYSEHPSDSDHYVVWVDSTAIYVDRFADSVQIMKFPIGKTVCEVTPIIANGKWEFLHATEHYYYIKLNHFFGDDKKIKHKVYKDKYITFEGDRNGDIEGDRDGKILFLNNPDTIINCDFQKELNKSINEVNGNIECSGLSECFDLPWIFDFTLNDLGEIISIRNAKDAFFSEEICSGDLLKKDAAELQKNFTTTKQKVNEYFNQKARLYEEFEREEERRRREAERVYVWVCSRCQMQIPSRTSPAFGRCPASTSIPVSHSWHAMGSY